MKTTTDKAMEQKGDNSNIQKKQDAEWRLAFFDEIYL